MLRDFKNIYREEIDELSLNSFTGYYWCDFIHFIFKNSFEIVNIKKYQHHLSGFTSKFKLSFEFEYCRLKQRNCRAKCELPCKHPLLVNDPSKAIISCEIDSRRRLEVM